VTVFSDLLQRDRERNGLRLARAAWLLGVSDVAVDPSASACYFGVVIDANTGAFVVES
jgi:hypothetical protein